MSLGYFRMFLCVMSLFASVAWAQEEDNAALAASLFYKQSDKLILTYDEFRGLSPEHQKEWIEDLRDFYSDVDRLGVNTDLPMDVAEMQPIEAFPWLKVMAFVPRWCSVSWMAVAGSTAAQAASNNCQVRNYASNHTDSNGVSHGPGVCLVCFYTMGAGNVQTNQSVEQCSSADPYTMNQGTVANELVSNIQKSNPNLGIKLTAADVQPGLKSIADGEGTYQIQAANPINPSGTFKIQDTAAGVKVTQVNPTEAEKKVSPADPMTVVQSQQDGAIVKQQTNTPGANVVQTKELGDTGSFKGNDNQDVDEYMARGKLACIYAGWALQGSGKENKGRCQAISEKVIFNEDGKRTKYSCRKPGTAAKVKPGTKPSEDANVSVVYGDSGNGKNTVLCNPVVFGLKDGKPICVPRATAKDKSVTKKCNEAARSADPDAKSALALAVKNPAQYRELTRRVETLCVNGGNDVAALKKIFAAKGQSEASIKASMQDLSDTCTVLQERMAVLKNANTAASKAAAGVR